MSDRNEQMGGFGQWLDEVPVRARRMYALTAVGAGSYLFTGSVVEAIGLYLLVAGSLIVLKN